MRQILVTMLLLAALCGSASADDKVIVIASGSRETITPEQIRSTVPGDEALRCVAYNPSVASTYANGSGQQAQTNARLIQWALQNQKTLGKILVIPVGRWYCVADHDADGADVYVSGVSGLSLISAAGWNDRISDDDVAAKYPSWCEGGLIHVGDVGTSGDVVLWLNNFRNCTLDLSIRGARAITFNTTEPNAQTAVNFADPENHAMSPCALRLTDEGGASATSGKSNISLAATLCYRAIDVYGDPTYGPDTIAFPHSLWRYCHYGMRVQGIQAIDFHFGDLLTSGSPMQRGIEFLQTGSTDSEKAGGVLKVDNWYLSPGTNLYVDSPAGDSRCDVHVRADQNVLNSATFKFLEAGTVNTGSAGDVRITGSLSGIPNHQTIVTGLCNVQTDLGNQFGDEGLAYPIRPTRLQWVPRAVQPASAIFSSTKLFVNPDRDRDYANSDTDDRYNSALNVITLSASGSTSAITKLADLSASANELVPSQASPSEITNPVVTAGKINNRDGVTFSQDYLMDETPTGVGAAIDDLMVDVTLVLTTAGSDAVNFVAGCTDPDATDGWQLYVNASEQVCFKVGTDDVMTSAAVLITGRPYRIVCTRTKSTGRWTMTINGLAELPDDGNSMATIPAVTAGGAFIMGSQQYNGGTGLPVNKFQGSIGPCAVDNVILSGDNLTARNSYMRQFGGY